MKLQPQHLKQSDWSNVAGQIEVFFYEEIIGPIVRIIKDSTAQKVSVDNSSADESLRRALRSGKIQYREGIFSGDFSAATSTAIKKMGGEFQKSRGIFLVPEVSVPRWVIEEAARYFQRSYLAHEAIRRELDTALEQVTQSRYDVDPSQTIARVDQGWRKSAAKIAFKPELTDEGKKQLAENYSQNLNLYIKKWMREDILALRQDVQENAEAGYRFDRLIKTVQKHKQVATSKAKFLARQETALFMSEYRQQRFKAVGVQKYQWSTAHDSRVRPAANLSPAERLHAGNHRILDGRIFEYDNPPIVDPNTGRRANPGQDYNCRCVDIPILD